MLRLRRFTLSLLLGASVACLLAAGPASGGNGTTVIKGHFEYDLFDQSKNMTFHFSCDEVRTENGDRIRETIHCKTTDTTLKSAVIFSPDNLFGGLYYWSSDFTGEQSKDFHLVGTPSGNLDGWATY